MRRAREERELRRSRMKVGRKYTGFARFRSGFSSTNIESFLRTFGSIR